MLEERHLPKFMIKAFPLSLVFDPREDQVPLEFATAPLYQDTLLRMMGIVMTL